MLWLCGSSEYATFIHRLLLRSCSLSRASFISPASYRRLHIAADILQDDVFVNDLMDAMETHLVARCHEMMLEKFLVEFPTDQREGFGRPYINRRLGGAVECGV